jgi:RND family efflux transporter MFP subunit
VPETSPPTVVVSYPLLREVRDYEEYTGRTAAIDSVQVRARVGGYLDKINFKEGADVKQEDVLYEIDPRPYQAALAQAKAQVELQTAQLKFNEAVYNRNVRLLSSGQAVSVEDVQQSLAQRDTTQAALNAAKANVEQAQLNLGFTKVRAPINGRIGRTLVTRGNLIVADQTLLTTIVSLDPIYAYFDVDEPTVLRIRQLIREGKFKSARAGAIVPVSLGLATEEGFPHEGHVDFVNNQVEPSTGTLQVRAIFPNPKPPVGERFLSPGLFVRVRVAIGAPYQALLVIQRALGMDQNLRVVYVLGDQDKVERRDVELGTQQGALQVVQKGLGPKDRVIVSGIQHVRPGMAVNAQLEDMPASPAVARSNSSTSNPSPAASRRPQAAPTMQLAPPSSGTRQQ